MGCGLVDLVGGRCELLDCYVSGCMSSCDCVGVGVVSGKLISFCFVYFSCLC